MYEYVKGAITVKHPTYVVVETGGVGYRLNISLHTYAAIEKEEKAQLLTYLHVKEDIMALYGFADRAERDIFELLIKVNGIGTNTARLILSSMRPEEVQDAVAHEDVNSFKAVKGIGPKTAKRIIIDLKDKIDRTEGSEVLTNQSSGNTASQEAFSALIALGFQQGQVRKAIQKIRQEQKAQTVEEYIKEGLKMLS